MNIYIFLIGMIGAIFLTLLLSSILFLRREVSCLKGQIETNNVEHNGIVLEMISEIEDKSKQLKEITSAKKSSEVKVGQLLEKWAPFLDEFPYNPKDAHFLGNPIDYVVFDTKEGVVEKVVFVEIKSGDSNLTSIQRSIRNAITEGRVSFEQVLLRHKEVKIDE